MAMSNEEYLMNKSIEKQMNDIKTIKRKLFLIACREKFFNFVDMAKNVFFNILIISFYFFSFVAIIKSIKIVWEW